MSANANQPIPDYPEIAMTSPRLGVLLGQAVGDALGAGTEFMGPEEIVRRHGEVRAYVQGENRGFAPGELTDDTQMALCILAAHWDVRRDGGDLAERTLRRFQEWLASRPADVGIATRGALDASRSAGVTGGFEHWERSGFTAAGNGALMRAAASIVAGTRGDELQSEAVALAALTHPDPRSLGACLVLVVALGALLDGATPDDAWRAGLDALDAFPFAAVLESRFGADCAAAVEARLPAAREKVRAAVEAGLGGSWESQSGYVVNTLRAAVAVSRAETYLGGILPIVARGDDSDTTAAVAGAVLGARGLLPPDDLVRGLICRHAWPTWPPGQVAALPVLAAFVPPLRAEDAGQPDDLDPDEEDAHRKLPTLPRFEFCEVAPRVLAGRAPAFGGNVRRLRAAGVTHVLDLREDHEWGGPGRYGRAAVEEIGRLGMVRLTVPVVDTTTPSMEDLDRGVAFLVAALHLGGTVFVHCRGGIERTGTFLLAWYARERGLSADDALTELRARRPVLAPRFGQLAAVRAWLRERPR